MATCIVCDSPAARIYPGGLLCVTHSPAGVAGRELPAPDPELTAAGLRRAPRPEFVGGDYGPAPKSARPFVRVDEKGALLKTAHLLPPGSAVALCGLPAGPHPRAVWERCDQTPGRDNRCRSCDLAMRSSNLRPVVPRYWWRA